MSLVLQTYHQRSLHVRHPPCFCLLRQKSNLETGGTPTDSACDCRSRAEARGQDTGKAGGCGLNLLYDLAAESVTALAVFKIGLPPSLIKEANICSDPRSSTAGSGEDFSRRYPSGLALLLAVFS